MHFARLGWYLRASTMHTWHTNPITANGRPFHEARTMSFFLWKDRLNAKPAIQMSNELFRIIERKKRIYIKKEDFFGNKGRLI